MTIGDFYPGSVARIRCHHGIPSGQYCPHCHPAYWPAPATGTFTVSAGAAAQGWQCPVCRAVMGPDAAVCPYCPPQPKEPPAAEEPEWGPVIILPPEMGQDGYVLAAEVGRGWTEVIPGIEARCVAFRAELGNLAAGIEFRLTPGDECASE